MNKLTDHRNLLGKDLLLCFDAFGTLFAPKIPVTEQYGEIARRHGLSGFSNDQLKEAFKIGTVIILVIDMLIWLMLVIHSL